jgi:hypothetical protein
VKRHEREGVSALKDRSPRPRRQLGRTPKPIARQVVTLRRQRWTMDRIAVTTGVSASTVSRILVRHGLSRSRTLEPAETRPLYDHEQPGNLLHVAIKKFGRSACPGDRRPECRSVGW